MKKKTDKKTAKSQKAKKSPVQSKAKTVRKPARPAAVSRPKETRPVAAVKSSVKKFPRKELDEFRNVLFTMRETLSGQVETLKSESLMREENINWEEEGTDAFERQFNLSIASSEKDSLFEIDEALRRIETADYGVCESCSSLIEKPRLKALPFVRLCVKCQAENEKRRARYASVVETERE